MTAIRSQRPGSSGQAIALVVITTVDLPRF